MKAKILSIIKDDEVKNWQLFLLLLVFNVFILVLWDNFVMTKEIYHVLLSTKLESYQIDNYYVLIQHYSIYNYLFIPVLLILRAVTVTMLIQLFFLFSLQNLKFKEVFKITLIGVGILLIGSLIKIGWLVTIPKEQLTQKMLHIMPLSLSNLIDVTKQDNIMIGVLNSINIFELIWLLTIGILIKLVFEVKFAKSILISFSVWSLIFLFQLGLELYFLKVLNG
ncbi:MAG: hypothetical protein M1480_11010 [Bacteroidetes bacterium]|nr:hypothetical protein [Bacteroidota bacterium]